MKRVISMFFGLLISVSAFSQIDLSKIDLSKIDYPHYEVDSLGQTVVVMTVRQAQILDNNTELLSLHETLEGYITTFDSVCNKTISDKDSVIKIQKNEIVKLYEYSDAIEAQNYTQSNIISEYKMKVDVMMSTLDNKDNIISNKNKQIKKMSRSMVIGGISGTLTIVGLLFALFL